MLSFSWLAGCKPKEEELLAMPEEWFELAHIQPKPGWKLIKVANGPGPRLAGEGAVVTVTARRQERLDALVDEMAQRGDLGLALVSMERRRHTLQELFRAPAGAAAHTREGAHGTRA